MDLMDLNDKVMHSVDIHRFNGSEGQTNHGLEKQTSRLEGPEGYTTRLEGQTSRLEGPEGYTSRLEGQTSRLE